MSKITQIYGEFKDIEDLKKFAEAQHTTITELSVKNKDLNDKLKHLEELLAKSTHIISQKVDIEHEYTTNEEKIAKDQLKMFAGVSKDRELTLEETRKVEIFSKIVLALANANKKKEDSPVKGKSTEELLELVNNDS